MKTETQNETKSFDLGFMPAKRADRVKELLHGKTYMQFVVTCGVSPSGKAVMIQTDYPDTDVEILTFALAVLASGL